MRAAMTLLAALCLAASGAAAGIDRDDAAQILNTLLNLEQPGFTQVGENGQSRYDALGAYRSWSGLYLRYRRLAAAQAVSQADLRLFLLLGKIAGETTDAATMEAFTADLMPVFEKHPEQVLMALEDLPFLVHSTCHYLNAYFGFEDRHEAAKPEFLRVQRPRIEAALPPANAAACLAYFGTSNGERE